MDTQGIGKQLEAIFRLAYVGAAALGDNGVGVKGNSRKGLAFEYGGD